MKDVWTPEQYVIAMSDINKILSEIDSLLDVFVHPCLDGNII